jgi:lysophospholipase L1-like esterase
VSVEEYANTLRRLADETLPKVKGMVFLTPYFFAKAGTDQMRESIDAYRAAMKQVAREKGVPCFDTQEAVDRALEHLHPCMLADDRVHPRTNGHMILARTFLEGVHLW